MRELEQPTIPSDHPGVIASMPRRQFLEPSGSFAISQMKTVAFKAGLGGTILQLSGWLRLLLAFNIQSLILSLRTLGNAPHRHAKQSQIAWSAKRAIYLRRAFERQGWAFVKLGLLLARRLDLLPWAYCNELAGMVDQAAPIPTGKAVAAVERSTGRPLAAIFARFDPQPILSSSVACHYQAELGTGELVVVKVRRPGAGEKLMQTLRALEWLLGLAEFLALFRPGTRRQVRDEFRSLLLEELDFVQAARRQDAFRRAAARSSKKFFSAPRVYLRLASEAVVVEQFASGMWLWELLAALEQGNQEVLEQARALDIDLRKVAQRLLWVDYWAWDENLFFHADPGPHNIIVRPGGALYFINFSATGSLSYSQRRAMRQVLQYASQQDAQNMARSLLILMEPLPPVDLLELAQELESSCWQLLYALEADPRAVAWQERTSIRLWSGLLGVARKYNILLDGMVLRLIQATLVYETMAARLDRSIDFVRQYRRYACYRAEQARRRLAGSLRDQLEGKTGGQTIVRLERIAQTWQGLLQRLAHQLSLPTANYYSLMSKASYAVYILARFTGQAAILTVVALALGLAAQSLGGRPALDLLAAARAVAGNPFYQAGLLLLALANGRAALFRLDDKEVRA